MRSPRPRPFAGALRPARRHAGGARAATLALALVAPLMVLGQSATAAPADSENVALGATVTASGREVPDRFGPELVNDGVRASTASGVQSRWSSEVRDGAWIQLELAEATELDHVTLVWETACAKRYRLQVSADGATWNDVGGVLDASCGGIDRIDVSDQGPIAFARMETVERANSAWGVSLWEFEAWTGEEPPYAPDRPDTVPALDLVPLPAEIEELDGEGYTLTPDSRFVAGPELAPLAELTAQSLRRSTGFALPVVEGEPTPADVELTLGGEADETGEAYTLQSGPDGVAIEAAQPHGVFNGLQTLRQLLPAASESSEAVIADWTVPALEISDAPRFGYRGVMIDVARSFLTVEELTATIDVLSSFKIDRLHLHLADDQGWRIEITNEGRADGDTIDYTRLTEVSGRTAMLEQGYQDEPGRTGFYTQQDYRDIVAHAQERFVEIVPEIDLPGHTNAALHAIPELNTPGSSHAATPEQPTAPHNGTGAVGYSYLDPDSEVTFTFIAHVLGQLAELTPGDLVHVGGDESHDMVERHGQQKFNDFVSRTIGIVHDLGKSANGWNEIARSAQIRSGDHVQYWNGETRSLQAATDRGAKVVVSRGVSSYLDMKYNAGTAIGLTWACEGTCDSPQYYDWDPATVIPELTEESVAGVEAPLWSETVRGRSQAEFLVFPRAAAFAEIGWTPQEQRDVADFLNRLGGIGPRLLATGANFYDSALVPWRSELAGSAVDADAGQEGTFEVGTLLAPGTRAGDDGAVVSFDVTDDADGVSSSDLVDASVQIDWGDGTSSPGTFSTARERGVLNAGSAYAVTGSHTYTAAGTYRGAVTLSDGRTAPFTAEVRGAPASLTVDPTTAAQGTEVTVTGQGFAAGEPVALELHSEVVALATVTADAAGNVSATVTIPADAPVGDHSVVAVGGVSAQRAEAPLKVTLAVAPAPGDPTDPPTTPAPAPSITAEVTVTPSAGTHQPPTHGTGGRSGLASTGASVAGLALLATALVGSGAAIARRSRVRG
ncbi:family 20 glycosylhydrolase [Litorihabitans aurantiacus]|uniref:beta-N-acetylhexosaminidase n=1 Tax=Litorihabitans aurantiacus TaxID=1930061 RepID=A0AA37XG35_9MICO|nr:family 20 glycosylhydrolase [Litorihabitans aurantiacus]GMA32449.1 hypothetical protein GCM10025875_24410 [Litorihabitans aurantiacus]